MGYSYDTGWFETADELKKIVGLTFTKVTRQTGEDALIFETADGRKFRMWHQDDCCESVTIDDINGELDWLTNSPILIAEETSNSDDPPKNRGYGSDDSFTWTFYRLATNKGTVVIRWYGTSNGYYSERVDFCEIKPSND